MKHSIVSSIVKVKSLEEISDGDVVKCALIANIISEYKIERFGGRDNGGIDITGKSGRGTRTLRIYYNGSNTRVMHEGFEVIEFCFEIYSYLKSAGYDVQPNKK